MYVELANGQNRRATKTEIAKRKLLREKITKLRLQEIKVGKQLHEALASCDHLIFRDIEGFPYDSRECVTCGKHLGLI